MNLKMKAFNRNAWRLGVASFFGYGTLLGAHAQSFTYNDFSSTAGLQLNGSAGTAPGDAPTVGTVLRLTPSAGSQAGSAFSTTTIALQNNASFSTEFAFQMANVGGIGDEDGTGADGIVFVVQSLANNVGGAGGGIGYAGINKSLGVEFDTYNNGGADGDGNHVSVDLNGVLTDTDLTHIPTRMNNGAVWHAWIDYNGLANDLQIRLSETGTRPLLPLIDYNVNLASILGQTDAFVGFTAGTGSGFEDQDIVSWKFNDTFQPIGGVPDVGQTLPLLGTSLAGLCLLYRRCQKRNVFGINSANQNDESLKAAA